MIGGAIRSLLFETAMEYVDGFCVMNQREQFLCIMKNKSLPLNSDLGKFLKVALKLEI